MAIFKANGMEVEDKKLVVKLANFAKRKSLYQPLHNPHIRAAFAAPSIVRDKDKIAYPNHYVGSHKSYAHALIGSTKDVGNCGERNSTLKRKQDWISENSVSNNFHQVVKDSLEDNAILRQEDSIGSRAIDSPSISASMVGETKEEVHCSMVNDVGNFVDERHSDSTVGPVADSKLSNSFKVEDTVLAVSNKDKEGNPPVPAPSADGCSPSGNLTCNGRSYPTYSCSPAITSSTPAKLTNNNFSQGGNGGGPSECDGKYHSNKNLIVALSTGWYNGGTRCNQVIHIRADNGRSVKAKVVDECDSRHGCDEEHPGQPPCEYDIVTASDAVWEALGLNIDVGVVNVTCDHQKLDNVVHNKKRLQRNQIVRLKDNIGVWKDKPKEVAGIIKDYFQNLYKEPSRRDFEDIISLIDPSISASCNANLVRSISMEEVQSAIFQLGALKAPGSDGFPGLFYQNYWEIVGTDVFKAIQNFFHDGILLTEVNQTNIVLIPKIPNPDSMHHLRRISLCRFIYKIISKILANRLQPFMSSIISEQ
ncbi:hypothetical protein Vadar_007995 [Vaccinium darrowii]|uniref:Uncharacterized protein n=1 Tax=Vaccinium darrowii TaxID=229202 RepID=A0ACB7X8X9_9ERIC|nr:hypothetical protein Vadar_007995 [Vaccinium darrowii]